MTTLAEKIIKSVAERTGASPAAIRRHHTGPARGARAPRNPREVAARQVAMLVLHRHARWSLPQTAELLGYRSHTSVLEGIQSAEAGINDAHLTAPAVALAAEIAKALDIGRRPEPFVMPPPRFQTWSVA
jgi:chromosomal replication initiation ATPase DnaA